MSKESKIIFDYQNNMSINSILDKYDIKERELRLILKSNKIDRNYNFYTEELYNRIADLYLAGYTQKKICEDLLVSENGIKSALKRKGIKKRSSSECNRKYKRNQNYFDKIDTPNKAYVLGFIYADGNNHINHNSLSISVQEEDAYILNAIKKELEYEGPLRFYPLSEKNPNYKNQYMLNINDEYISKRLEELGVVNNKSLILKFPDFITKELMPEFIRGYFDGDGNIYYDYKRSKCQTQTVGTKDFCEHLSNILLNMGCKNNIKHPKQCNENTFIIQTSGNKSSYSFLSWMYENAELKLIRKYNTYLTFSQIYKPNES